MRGMGISTRLPQVRSLLALENSKRCLKVESCLSSMGLSELSLDTNDTDPTKDSLVSYFGKDVFMYLS